MRIPTLRRGERNTATDETPTEPITTTRPARVDTRPERVETRPDRVDTRETTRPDPVPVAEPRGPRPRASIFATITLVIGVAAALFVLTGVLAGYGIVLGALAVLLSIGGISATSRRHVAGKSDAMLGLVLGLAAIVVGVLVVTDQLTWLSTATDKVGELRNWLDTQTVDRF